jgi:uncharacterized protein (TIGR00255 family)
MTGFSRANGIHDGSSWAWEIRSVNGKGLDVRLRLPQGFEHLEIAVRKACGAHLNRGNLQVSLSLRGQGRTPLPTVNTEALKSVLAAVGSIENTADVNKSSAAQILALRGVTEILEPEMDQAETEALDKALLVGLAEALKAMQNHRTAEGKELASVLLSQISQIESLTETAKTDPATNIETIRQRYAEQIASMQSQSGNLDQDRLHQEAAILATKADIREELDRLNAHTIAARDLIEKGSPVGRKLEFMAQEFNREANTLCSKANALSITETGLELKVVIDQFREQVLNVE